MSIQRQILIVCDQTGEELLVTHGEKFPVPPNSHGYVPTVDLSGGGGLRAAAEFAYKLGWQSHTRRSVDGYFSTFRSVPSGRGSRGYYIDWWTAPGVEADPPMTQTALQQLEVRNRREAQSLELDSQIERLSAEIDRLRQLQAETVTA